MEEYGEEMQIPVKYYLKKNLNKDLFIFMIGNITEIRQIFSFFFFL